MFRTHNLDWNSSVNTTVFPFICQYKIINLLDDDFDKGTWSFTGIIFYRQLFD